MKNASPIESNLDMNQSKTDANCARRNPVVTNQDKQGSLSFFTRCFDRFQIGGTLLDTVVSCGVPILNILSSATNTNTNKGIAMLCRSFVCFLEPSLV